MHKLIPAISSSQPSVDPKFIIYGAKVLPTIKVQLKGSDKKMIINASDFDSAKHKRLS